MLHNTGTFSQNEVPINPNDQVNLSSQNDNISSNNNLSKTGHQPPQALPFNDPEYNTYGINMNAGLSQFHNAGLQTNTHTHENWPNNMSPMNLNVQNEQSLLNFHGLEKSETNIDFKGHCAKKTLNMPPVYTKAYHKQMDIDYNYYRESYSLVNYDMNLINNKSSAKTQFVKENLDLTAQNLALSDAPSLNNEYNRIGTTLEISYTKTETDNQDNNFHTLSQESSCYELDLSNKPVPNIKTENISHLSNKLLKDDSRKQLEKKVKMIENIISHPSNSRKIKMEEENFKSEYSDSDLDLSDTSDQDFFSNSHKTSKTNNNVKLKKNQTKTQKPIVSNKHSVTNKAKHKKIKIEILANNEDGDNNRSKDNIKVEDGVVVKAETAPTTLNIEQFNPFLRDTYGVHIEETKDCDIIGAENSINVAKEIIKNGSSLKTAFFECPHCKLFFNNAKRFLIHTKWHTFGYITEKKLRSQKEKIVKPRIRKKISEAKEPNDNEEGGDIPCADCKRTFNSTLSLSEHRRKYHPTRVRECKICAKTVVGMTALRTHIATHTTTDSKFQCTDCPKWFKYAHSLAKHRDTHLEKTHECSQCPKKFGSVALLNVHMKTHERVLRGATFRCTYCGKGFFESYSLQAHERTHRNERPYICEICNTSFGTNSSLKRHLKVSHSTSKPYECSTCHRSFVSESIRDRHAVRYHGDPNEFKFVCKLCPCKYLNARELRRHVYKVHPKPKMKIEVESD